MTAARTSLQAIHYFDAAARHRSFTRAADELCVTQSAISKQISNLESSLGVILFERTRRGAHLTAEGQILYAVTQAVLENLEACIHSLRMAQR